MQITEWKDAKIEKPITDDEGVSDVVLVLTSNGFPKLATYHTNGWWYELETGEEFGNVVWWFNFLVPHGYRFDEGVYK